MSGTIHVVKTPEEFYSAVQNASGGDRIELAPGDYGDIALRNMSFDESIVITSQDPDNPAIFNTVKFWEVSNVTFDNLLFDFRPNEETVEWDSALRADNSSDISIINSRFEGGPAVAGISADSEPGSQGAPGIEGEPIGRAMTFNWSQNIVIENNDISQFGSGVRFGEVDGVIFNGNEIYDFRNVPVGGADVSNLSMENNYFHDANPWNFGGLGDHGDFVHFWTSGPDAPVSENHYYANNVFDQGDGTAILGIYLDDNSNGVGFSNVVIENNLIYNGNAQALRMENVDGLQVLNNTLLQSSGDKNDAPLVRLVQDSRNVVIEGNILGGVNGDSLENAKINNVLVGNNLVVQTHDPQADGYYGALFVTSASSVFDIQAVPGDMADGIGSSFTQFDWSPDTLSPQFLVRSEDATGQTLVFDASLTAGPSGLVSESDAEFRWTFGDGSTATGQIVKHGFTSPGHHEVTLTVLAKDGTTAQAQFTAGIAGDDIVQFDSQAGLFVALAYGEERALDEAGLPLQKTNDGYVLDLGAPGVAASVAKEDIQRFFGAEAFEITMTVQADKPLQSAGEVARIHGSFIMKIDQSGVLTTTLFTDDGAVEVKTSGVRLNDGQAHDIMLRFDGEADEVEVLVDGSVAGSASVTGEMPVMQHWGLVFGNPWGDPNFDGKLSAFGIASEINDFPIDDGPVIVDADAEETQTEISPPAEDATVIDEPESDPDPVAEPEVDGQPEEDSKVLPEGEDSGALDPVEGVIGEVHKIVLDHNETVLQLDNSFENPVVIAHVASMNGGQPVTVRLNQVSSNEVRLSLQEPNYLDGKHLPEDVIVMVLEAGVHELADGTRIEAGTLESDKLTSAGFESVAFDRGFEERPVILSQAQTRNGGDFVVTRQDGADANGFRLAMQEEEALNGGGHLSETLGWVAIEPGAGDWFGIPFAAGTTGDQVGHRSVQQSFGTTFAEEPLVFASLASHDGADTAWAVATGVTRDGFSAHVREETSSDRETAHTRETVDFLAFGGTGTLRGLSADATPLEAELVSGVNDSSVPEDDLYDFTLDIAAFGSEGSTATLVDDAHVVTDADGLSVRMDGDKDFVALGRLHEFETSSQLTFDVTFQRENPDTGAERLVWNHLKTGLTIEGDNLRIHVASPDRSFSDGFVIRNAGVLDAEEHNARVIIDSDVDRLQVVLDGEVVLDEQGVDLDLTADAGRQWGWSLGTAWDRFFEGEVSDFRIDAEARFIDELNDQSDGTVLASA